MRLSQLARLLPVTFVVALVLVIFACGRTSLEPEVLGDGGTGVVRPCGPATCPTGCCDANGTCRTGADTRACGSGGGRCSDCVANGFSVCTASRVCGRDDPGCSPATCPGCCGFDEGRQRCLSGTEAAACGNAGTTCSDCKDQGRACEPSTHSCSVDKCDATNCDGCCVGDKCLPGSSATACGAKGATCQSCAVGQACNALAGGGGTCEGIPSCGPGNCGGCCTPQGQCIDGTDDTACGKQGAICLACGFGKFCVPDGQPNERTCQNTPTCGPDNCAGCCVNNQCVTQTTAQSCGRNGEACVTCPDGNTCNGGVCQPNGGCLATCATCCVGEICAIGTQDTACGLTGGACQNCAGKSPAQTCQGGVCATPACGPGNCAGCCSKGVCVSGTQDTACGPQTGQVCDDCTAVGGFCQNRQCKAKCGPGNCNGCCGANNQCQLGIANNACGEKGVVCANCTTTNSFCNGLVEPRRCNDQQSTCPAPYDTCPGGVMMQPVPANQNLCSAGQLDAIAAACANPHADGCVAAIAAVTAACGNCVKQFAIPFSEDTGLRRCAISITNLPGLCRRAAGCSAQCTTVSCQLCSAASASQCIELVNGLNGQCRVYDVGASVCTAGALQAGQFCSQFSYATFSAWLRAVTGHFCG